VRTLLVLRKPQAAFGELVVVGDGLRVKANWDKIRSDVRISIVNFEAKITAVARRRAVEQLENLNI